MTRAMVWFRRDLSLEDNLAWSKATVDHAEVLPVYVLDHRLLDAAGPYRRRQFIASLPRSPTNCAWSAATSPSRTTIPSRP